MCYDCIFKNRIIMGLLIMIISAFISYKISYYLTEEIEASCFLSGAISVITFIMSIDFLLNL